MERLGRREMLAVAGLLTIAAGLRLWRLDLGWFGVDQARDIQTALDVAAGHDWPTVGPTMRRVTSLGAFYYYFWALPYLTSRDPVTAYWFAAGLGTLTVGFTWALVRRWLGSRPALVTLAVMATSRVAVIDGRVAWAPAALPAVAVLLLWFLIGQSSVTAQDKHSGPWDLRAAGRLGLLGGILGLALQLHLAMVAWLAAAVIILALHPPGWRPLVAGGLGLALTGWPALSAALANTGQDAGVMSLPGRGPFPDLPARLLAVAALAWRVPPAFWQWNDAPEAWPGAAQAAAMIVQAVTLLGIIRLVAATFRGERAARAVLVVGAVQLGMVAILPGEAWYYYLDAMLPWWAIAAGAFFAPSPRSVHESFPGDAPGAPRNAWISDLMAAAVIAATLVLALHTAAWLGEIARHGYFVLDPAALTLDGVGGRDASASGRLVTLGTKRAVAAVVATEPAPLARRWLATHGPAFDDATGDNGFWFSQMASSEADPAAAVTHAALWYRDDPAAPTTATSGFELVTVGPFVVARYRASILYDRCHDEHRPVTVPMRVVPHPRGYGDGSVARPSVLPVRVDCALEAGTGATRVVAAVTGGIVRLRAADGAKGVIGHESTLCVPRGEQPTPFAIEITLPAGIASDLDLYERPDPSCAAGKIAP